MERGHHQCEHYFCFILFLGSAQLPLYTAMFVSQSVSQLQYNTKDKDDFINMTMFYSRVRVRVYNSSILPNNWAEQSVCLQICIRGGHKIRTFIS